MNLSASNLPAAPAPSRYAKTSNGATGVEPPSCHQKDGGFDEVLADVAQRRELPDTALDTRGSQMSAARRNGVRGLEMRNRESSEQQPSSKKKAVGEKSC